jgi:ParB-like nuclease domain
MKRSRPTSRHAASLTPIKVDEDRRIIDGHHRYRASKELGLRCPARLLERLSDEEKRAHAYTLNLARRHPRASRNAPSSNSSYATIRRARTDPSPACSASATTPSHLFAFSSNTVGKLTTSPSSAEYEQDSAQRRRSGSRLAVVAEATLGSPRSGQVPELV